MSKIFTSISLLAIAACKAARDEDAGISFKVLMNQGRVGEHPSYEGRWNFIDGGNLFEFVPEKSWFWSKNPTICFDDLDKIYIDKLTERVTIYGNGKIVTVRLINENKMPMDEIQKLIEQFVIAMKMHVCPQPTQDADRYGHLKIGRKCLGFKVKMLAREAGDEKAYHRCCYMYFVSEWRGRRRRNLLEFYGKNDTGGRQLVFSVPRDKIFDLKFREDAKLSHGFGIDLTVHYDGSTQTVSFNAFADLMGLSDDYIEKRMISAASDNGIDAYQLSPEDGYREDGYRRSIRFIPKSQASQVEIRYVDQEGNRII